MAAGAINAGFSLLGLGLSAHHKKAVATENNTLGAALPQAQQTFQDVMQQFSAGVIDAATAQQKLQDAVDTFKSRTAGIRKQSGQAGETGDPWAGGKCNAACVYLFQLQKQADDLKAQIKAATGGNVSASGTTPGVSVSGGSIGHAPAKAGSVPRSNNATVPMQQFSVASGLDAKTLTLALGGLLVFVVLMALAGAMRHKGE